MVLGREMHEPALIAVEISLAVDHDARDRQNATERTRRRSRRSHTIALVARGSIPALGQDQGFVAAA
jgi:hypothetical protein